MLRPRSRLAPAASGLALIALGAVACAMNAPDELGSTSAALTGTVTVQRGTAGVVADTFISAAEPRKNHGDQKKLRVSRKNEALLRFDVSAIPANAVLTSAALTLYVNGGDDEDDDDCDDGDHEGHPIAPLKLHRVTHAWTERTVTYASFSQQFDPAVAGVIALSNRNSYKTVDLKSLVQSWVNGTRPNYGLLVETQGRAHTLIVSSEQQPVNQRPALRITYTTPDDHCRPNPCQHGGTCANAADGFTCECPAGYGGNACQTDVDDCAPNPCQHGTCADGVAGYTCTCGAGYAGLDCQTNVNDCAPNPCQHGGVCTDGVADHTCACAAGYGGADCQIEIDDCAGAPCQNGATCIDGVAGYACACVPGFAGGNCQINVDDCVGNPCHNGATCNDGVAGYTCSCAPGFGGGQCDVDLDDCIVDACLGGGTCHDAVLGYTCACAPGFTGGHCEIDVDDCAASPCQHGGQCVDGVNSFTCACTAGFGGGACETDLDHCAPGLAGCVHPTCGDGRVEAAPPTQSFTLTWLATTCAPFGVEVRLDINGVRVYTEVVPYDCGCTPGVRTYVSTAAEAAAIRAGLNTVDFTSVALVSWAVLTVTDAAGSRDIVLVDAGGGGDAETRNPDLCGGALVGGVAVSTPFQRGDEQCDDGNTSAGDGCGPTCLFEACGNALVDPDEACDDGNSRAGDGCSASCLVEACGNRRLDVLEECDDGNLLGGDGCGPTCLAEVCGNRRVEAREGCDDGNTLDGDGCDSACREEICGNWVLQAGAGEECDDGNRERGDGCDDLCHLEICGNGRQENSEGCDDGNTLSGDGCSATCVAEFCGDQLVQAAIGETCDDGNYVNGDGCTLDCRQEVCGDGVVTPDEQCDDGNSDDSDGCGCGCKLTATDANNCGSCGFVCGDQAPTCAVGACVPRYSFSGVRTNVPVADLIGWTQCFSDTYADEFAPLSEIRAACSGHNLMLACRPNGSPDLSVLAYAPRDDVFHFTGRDSLPHDANGVGWYYSDNWSWGFAPSGAPVSLMSCDTVDSSFDGNPGGTADQRLCWTASAGGLLPGWRCGATDSLYGAPGWERMVFQAN